MGWPLSVTGGSTNVAKAIDVQVCCSTLSHLQKWEWQQGGGTLSDWRLH